MVVTAHRTGGKLGQIVSESVEDAGDPDDYLILTNNDYELTGFSNGDFTYDGGIDIDDFGELAAHWGMILPEQPVAPNELIATGATGYNAIAVSWTQPVWGHSGYRLYRSIDGGALWDLHAEINDPSWTSFIDEGLNEGTKYTYRVRSYIEGVGNSLTSNKFSAVTFLPAPTDLYASNLTTTSLLLSWHDNAHAETGYRIDVQPEGGTRQTLMTIPDDGTPHLENDYTQEIEGLLPGVEYSFWVTAVGQAANSADSLPLIVTTLPHPDSPQPASGLSTVGTAWTDGVTFSWQDNATDEDWYLVEWSNGVAWHVIDELPANSTTYTDDYPVLGSQRYRVRAGKGTGEIPSSPSSVLSVNPIAPPVAWHDQNSGANDRGTLSPFSVSHSDADGITLSVVPNDVDYENSPIWIAGYDQPDSGSLTLDLVNGNFTYVPEEDFVGTVSFEYHLSDGVADSAPATVAIDVTNDIPVANGQDIHVGAQLGDGYRHPLVRRLDATDGDNDALTYDIDLQPLYGTINLEPATGDFEYIPSNYDTFPGLDRFTFTASDGLSESLPATVTIDVDLNRVISEVYHFGDQWMYEWSPDQMPVRGSITFTPAPGQPSPTPQGYQYPSGSAGLYTPNTETIYDYMTIVARVGDFESKPIRNLYQRPYETWPGGDRPYLGNVGHFQVSEFEPTTQSAEQTGFKPDGFEGSVRLDASPLHGVLTLEEDGGFLYVPAAPVSGEPPFMGLDYFKLIYTQPDGMETMHWVELYVGAPPPRPIPVTLDPPEPENATTPTVGETLDGLRQGYDAAKTLLRSLLDDLVTLGQGVNNVSLATDDQIRTKLDAATGPVDDIATKYDQYLSLLAALAKAAGKVLAEQSWWDLWRGNVNEVVTRINALPTRIGSMSASKQKMEELADALDAQGDGAAIAVDSANKMVRSAEVTHKVLTTIELAGGATALLKTGATLLFKEGFKACAKQAAKEFMQQTASSIASEMANYAAALAGIPEEQRQYIAIGVDAYQTFAFLKAAKTKVDWNASCFAAGTNVIVGINADGSSITLPIEQIEKGDYVLSRDQYDAGDNVELHRVTEVFHKTSDHLRVLTIEGDIGNVETIRTTDEHPFFVEGRGWSDASELRLGDQVQETDGSWQTVLASEREDHSAGITVYNFTVEGDHTYFVEDGNGAVDAVWVHNACGTPTEALHKASKFKGAARDDLRADMKRVHGDAAMDGNDAHHAIPLELTGDGEVGDIIARGTRGGWHYNAADDNGVIAPADHGPHPVYTGEIKEYLLLNQGQAATPTGAAGLLRGLANAVRQNPDDFLWEGPQ